MGIYLLLEPESSGCWRNCGFLATIMLASVIIVGVVILQSLAEQQALGMLKSSCFFSNKK